MAIWSCKINITYLWAIKLHKKLEQLNFHDLTGFRSSFTLIWKILSSLGGKIAKNEIVLFWYFMKFVIIFLKNDLKSAKIWPSTVKQYCIIYLLVFLKILPFSSKNDKIAKMLTKSSHFFRKLKNRKFVAKSFRYYCFTLAGQILAL